MAEAFATSAAVVGLVAAAGQLIDGIMKLNAFCSQIRDIPKEILDSLEDLSIMSETLAFVKAEIGEGSTQTVTRGTSTRILTSLQKSVKDIGEVLEEMQLKFRKRKYWGRVKAVAMKRKLEKAAARVQNAHLVLLISLTTENRVLFQQSFNAQRHGLTETSVLVSRTSNVTLDPGGVSRDCSTNMSSEGSNSTEEAFDALGRAIPRRSRNAKRVTGLEPWTLRLAFPTWALGCAWEFSVYRATQGLTINLQTYQIRPFNANIFLAIETGNIVRMRQLLSSREASIYDRDPIGRGLLHYAAVRCTNHDDDGTDILESLVKCGADVNAVTFDGLPVQFFLGSNESKDSKIRQSRMERGYKILISQSDWTSPVPTTRVLRGQGWSDALPLFEDIPKAVVRFALKDMWPPWDERTLSGRIDTLFPNRGGSFYGVPCPSAIRLLLSPEMLQNSFSSCDANRKMVLAKYAVRTLASQNARGVYGEYNAARLFLEDILASVAFSDIFTPLGSPMLLFINTYIWLSRNQGLLTSFQGEVPRITSGLRRYVSEFLRLGISMSALIDTERKGLQHKHHRRITSFGVIDRNSFGSYRVIGLNSSPEVNDWHLWLSNPLDEWAGEFWNMIDHPERAIPGAFEEEW